MTDQKQEPDEVSDQMIGRMMWVAAPVVFAYWLFWHGSTFVLVCSCLIAAGALAVTVEERQKRSREKEDRDQT